MPAQTDSDDQLTGSPEAETDAGPPRAGKAGASRSQTDGPERRCIATMQRRPQHGMIRFVLSPEGQVTPDVAARLPGRGAWVTASREALDLAAGRGAFPRAFKRQVTVPADLTAQTEALLARRCLDMLGMARRAGDLILGYEQVRETVRDARPACLIAAIDASEDQRGKVLALVRGLYGPDLQNDPQNAGNGRLPPVAGCFSGAELGMALGRDRVIHACLKLGPIAHAWMGELERLSGFRRVWLPGWQPASGSEEGARGETLTTPGP
ncbi:MAG: RNA-binding protein [Hyphomonadaceae bacterium]